MKRCVAILLTLVLLLPVSALCESLDLTNFSVEELLTLRQSIETELLARTPGSQSSLSCGLYTVGKNLLPGSYTFGNTKNGDDACIIGAYYSMQEYKDKNNLAYAIIYKDDAYSIYSEDNMVLCISGHSSNDISASVLSYVPAS